MSVRRVLSMLALGSLATFGLVAPLASCGSRGTTSEQEPEDLSHLSPEISHSKGVEGGLVLLWPRVVPKAETGAMRGPAKALQDRLKNMLSAHFPGRPIDVRPEPERVCPREGGCVATSVGVLIAVKDGGCVAVVIVSPPGMSDQLLMPWAGLMTTKLQVPFREPPESSMRLQEMVPCDTLPVATLEREDRVKDALKIAE